MTNKIKDILKTHKYLLLSFFLPVLLLEGIAIAEKIQPHFILENAVERMRYPLLRSEWHMDYAVIWLATVGILCGWKS